MWRLLAHLPSPRCWVVVFWALCWRLIHCACQWHVLCEGGHIRCGSGSDVGYRWVGIDVEFDVRQDASSRIIVALLCFALLQMEVERTKNEAEDPRTHLWLKTSWRARLTPQVELEVDPSLVLPPLGIDVRPTTSHLRGCDLGLGACVRASRLHCISGTRTGTCTWDWN